MGQILSTVVAVAASYFLSPVLGNVVSQGFNNLIGTQSGFSFKSLGIAVVTQGINSGLDGSGVFSVIGISGGEGLTGALNAAARAAITSGVTQGIATATERFHRR